MNTIYTLIKTPFLDDDNINESCVDYSASIRNNFDNVIDKNIYDDKNCYENLYKQFKKIITKDKTLINFSSDSAISAASLAALNEIYAYKSNGVYMSDLKIIYIDIDADLQLNNYDEIDKIDYKIASKSVVSNLISLSHDDIKRSYTKHLIDLELSQFIFFGIEQLTSFEENLLLQSNSKYYTLNNIHKKIENLLDNIIEENKDNPIAIIFDTKIFNSKLRYNNITNNNHGINIDQLHLIIEKFFRISQNIKMIDITGFNMFYTQNNTEQLKSNINLITKIYGKILNLKEYSLNIFTENTRFLIYKPIEEIEDTDDTYNSGWYILRNIPFAMKTELLENLDPDSIIILDIPDDDMNDVQIMIGTTTINEQNEKCFYLSKSYKDCCLYPDEKLDMMFELVNN